jgi:nucleoside-diphosphate-sugar epimerase
MNTFRGAVRRVVAISSQDVYRAYGVLMGAEPGPEEPVPLGEESPVRTKLYPYRDRAQGPDDLLYNYDKIPIERAVMGDPGVLGTVLRLPMVYGPGDGQHRLFEYLKRMDDCRPAIILAEELATWKTSLGRSRWP